MAKEYIIEEIVEIVEAEQPDRPPEGGTLHVKLTTPKFPPPKNLPKLPPRDRLKCNKVPASQLYVDLATANNTYVTAVQSAMAALGAATTAIADAQATFYEAQQTHDYDVAVAQSTRVEAYYNAGLTFLKSIFPS